MNYSVFYLSTNYLQREKTCIINMHLQNIEIIIDEKCCYLIYSIT